MGHMKQRHGRFFVMIQGFGQHALDRHWRNARVHTLHDPVRWKYHAIGAYRLNGTLPARHSWI